jgi:hypothetical protein
MRLISALTLLALSLVTIPVSYAQQQQQQKRIENIDMTDTRHEGVYIQPPPGGSGQKTPSGNYTYPRGTEPGRATPSSGNATK